MTQASSMDPLWVEHGYGTRFQGFQNLMRKRIRDVLLVSSLYDLYLFEEDGRLYELIRNEYQGLHLSHSPELTRVSSGREAVALAQEESRFDLIITTLHVEDMSALQLVRRVREAGLSIPVILLAYDNRELKDLLSYHDTSIFDGIFIWLGDFRLLIAIIKHLEDRMNVEHDTRMVGVQSIILIEDNVRYYSSFLPIIYTEVLNQSQRLILEGINLSHRYLRMRARPKILLCKTYEEAMKYFQDYEDHILGVISDIDFPRNGVTEERAGFAFAREVKERYSDIPILLQSTTPEYEYEAHEVGASFLLKDSPTLLLELRAFMNQYFSFGDFIFRMPDGTEVARATDLKSLEEHLKHVPKECVRYHAERNHFSRWLKARTEFWLAYQLRPRKVSDYPSVEDLRKDLIDSMSEYRGRRQRGLITDFSKETFDPTSSLARIGGGSLGGKARGLGFVNILINNYQLRERFDGVQITVPPAVILGTEVFDQFVDENNLRKFALKTTDDNAIARKFLEAPKFPEEVLGNLAAFLDLVNGPLAVRSSSLLEDSQYHPFAGVYETYMIPNNNPDPMIRLRELLSTVKRVYASTFYKSAKDYFKVTSYRLEEEKMAVIIQRMVGAQHRQRFYPDFAGVAKSYNFYPIPPQTPQDGIVSVAHGLGKTIVDGGVTVRFCPRYPRHILQFSTTGEALRNNQTEFYALELTQSPLTSAEARDALLKRYPLAIAEEDGTLQYTGSTYSRENDALYDGLAREGMRIVTFAPILNHNLFPLPSIVELLLDMGTWGMGTPVEIEFAVTMSVPPGQPREFALVQMRPLVLSRETEQLMIAEVGREVALCRSSHVLGHGVVRDVRDIVVVDFEGFERSKTQEVAREVTQFNEKLVDEGRPYVLIGVGRWGTLDPWLGIPVKWEHISGARVIVEAGFKDLDVAPSQGSHFFQNITSFMVGYFTVSGNGDFVDWEWLRACEPAESKRFVRHLRFDQPLVIKMNGHENKGIILKPGHAAETRPA
ncbi:MAG: phosphoenolpyruvate synthase [Bacteroidia bacterium]|nr:MAG: phosphoenolpyruvate synthase [Bacteroidia bacterium]